MNDMRVTELPVEVLQLSVRARKAIKALECRTLGEIARLSEMDLLRTKNFGETALNEMRQNLKIFGLTFRRNSEVPSEIDLSGERLKIFSQNRDQTLAEFEKKYSDWMTSNQVNIVILDRCVSTTVEYNHDRTNRLTDITIFYRSR